MIRRIAAIAAALPCLMIFNCNGATAMTDHAWKTPNLAAGFTPQGMAYWYRTGANMVIMAEYKPGSNTRLVAVNPGTGIVYGQVSIAENHAGGAAIVGDWMFIQDQPHDGGESVRRYRMSDLERAFDYSHKHDKHPVYVTIAGVQSLGSPWAFASYAAEDNGQLLAGHYGIGSNVRMYRYDVDQKTGLLDTENATYVMTPEKVQGVAVMNYRPVYASSSHIRYGITDVSVPAHIEGLVILKGTAYASFEAGAKWVLKIKL